MSGTFGTIDVTIVVIVVLVAAIWLLGFSGLFVKRVDASAPHERVTLAVVSTEGVELGRAETALAVSGVVKPGKVVMTTLPVTVRIRKSGIVGYMRFFRRGSLWLEMAVSDHPYAELRLETLDLKRRCVVELSEITFTSQVLNALNVRGDA